MANQKIRIHLTPLQETLLLPLWARAVETRQPQPILEDRHAVEFMAQIEYDFSKVEKKFGIVRPTWPIKARTFDGVIREFIVQHPHGTIVNLGAGLDTTFFRVDNGRIRWYDLDLPESMALRRQLVTETDRLKFISASALETSWLEQIELQDGGVLFMAAGLLFYFEKPQIQGLFARIEESFPQADVLFDFIAPRFVKEGSKYRWGIEDASSLAHLHPQLVAVQQWRYYNQFPRKWNLAFQLLRPFILKWGGMVHARFSKSL